MPGLYTPPDYDLAGFIVGYVEESRILGAQRVRPDDVLIGLPSSGLHTNGYSLARMIVTDRLKLRLSDPFPGGGGAVADVLLAGHRSYLTALKPVLDRVHSMAHITGGGLLENLDRALPKELDAVISVSSWETPNVFRVLMDAGSVAPAEMYRTFNMGVGMVVICAPSDQKAVLSAASALGSRAGRSSRSNPVPGQSYFLEELIMKGRLFVSFVALALAATSASAQDLQRCPPGTANGLGVPDQTRASQDACQKAIDLFQYLAPQLATTVAGGNATLGQAGSLVGLGHFSVGFRVNALQGLPQVQNVTPWDRRKR
jgi:hypothetical protein